MPKNITDKAKGGYKNDISNNSGISYGFNKDNSINSKKKNLNKSNEHFEKDKKQVSFNYLFYYYIILYIILVTKKNFFR